MIAPLSVMPTWLAEMGKWTPHLKGVYLYGPKAERQRIKVRYREAVRGGSTLKQYTEVAHEAVHVGGTHWSLATCRCSA